MWLLRLEWAYLRKQWFQSLLLILGLALGTAVVVAVDLANQSAARSFSLSQEAFGGRTTHRLSGRDGSLDEAVYRRLRLDWPQIPSAPVISETVKVSSWQDRPMRLLGVDPFAEGPFRSYFGTGTEAEAPRSGPDSDADAQAAVDYSPLLTRDDTVLIPAALAAELPPTRRLQVSVGNRQAALEAVGQLAFDDPLLRASLGNVLLADIGTAQRLLGMKGRLGHVDLILKPEQVEPLRQALPPGIELVDARAQSGSLQQMSRAFSLNLSALSLLALVVGMFLVYNTVSFAVLRRRAQIGTLRTLGVTRREIAWLVLGESLLLGLIGSALGLVAGIWLGRGMLALVVQTINDLYYSLEVTRLEIEPLSLIKGVAGALAAAFAATLLPALEATRTPPAGVMRASTLEARIQPLLARLAALGLLLVVLGTGLSFLPLPLWGSFLGFVGVIAGAALIVPLLTRLAMQGLAGLLGPVLRLAPRQLARSLSRSAVAIAALMVAVSVVISVSLMIGSFRQSVISWLDQTLSADYYLYSDSEKPLPAALPAQAAAIPGIVRIESARNISVESPGGHSRIMALSADIARRRYVWQSTDHDRLWQRLKEPARPAVMVSQPFASKRGIASAPGQQIQLMTPQGLRPFEVLAIYYDYSSDQGVVLMAQSLYRQIWQDTSLSTLSLFAAPNTDSTALAETLRRRFAGPYQLQVQSQGELKQGAITVFERTFAITGALRLLAILVACLGIFSTLMSLLLERQRSFGMLRALGLTRMQLAGLMLFESGLMGLAAGLSALPLGVILSLFLIYVINLRSFGWTMELIADPGIFAQGLLLALGSSLLAGLYPAWRLARQRIAQSMRWE